MFCALCFRSYIILRFHNGKNIKIPLHFQAHSSCFIFSLITIMTLLGIHSYMTLGSYSRCIQILFKIFINNRTMFSKSSWTLKLKQKYQCKYISTIIKVPVYEFCHYTPSDVQCSWNGTGTLTSHIRPQSLEKAPTRTTAIRCRVTHTMLIYFEHYQDKIHALDKLIAISMSASSSAGRLRRSGHCMHDVCLRRKSMYKMVNLAVWDGA